MPGPLAIAAIAGPLLGGVGGLIEGRKVARANIKANELEERRRAIQNVLARRKTKAEARRLSAQVRAQALRAGVGLGSGAESAASGVVTQTEDTISTQRQFEDIDLERNQLIKDSNSAGQRAQNFSQIGSLIGSAAGGFG